MRSQPASEENRAAALIAAPRSRAPWRVRSVVARPDFVLDVEFMDGATGSVDLSALVRSVDAGVFASLQDEALFQTAHAQDGVVTWSNGLDLAPDAMYRQIRAHGAYRLGGSIGA